MKAKIEKIEPSFGNSFTLRHYEGPYQCNTPFWHCHPEYELVYIQKGNGTRHIGNHLSHFYDGELIFIGPNLPHFPYDNVMTFKNSEIVVQMKADFLGKTFFDAPELFKIKQLFEKSHAAIIFDAPFKHKIGKKLHELLIKKGFDRLLGLLDILNDLAETKNFQLLHANSFTFEVNSTDYFRIQTIYEFVQANFKEDLNLATIANKINMTEPAFCRYFKRLTGKTFTNLLNEIRIAHACQLLYNEEDTIATIAFKSGFNNLSHFNKQFKNVVGYNPSVYRKVFFKAQNIKNNLI